MDENNLLIYQDITTLINGIEDKTSGNADLKVLLDVLRKSLLDKNQTSANVVAIQTHIKESSILIDENQKYILESILSRLANADTVSALGGNAYEQSREEILAALPHNLRIEVQQLFTQFELEAENLDNTAKKERLSNILNYISNNATTYEIDPNDLDGIFLKEICNILTFYDLTSSICPTESPGIGDIEVPLENVSQKS